MDRTFDNKLVTRAIVDTYHKFYRDALVSDALIAGAGPSGTMAAILLAEKGCSVTIIEKKLSPGGGVPGGGMLKSKVVVQENAKGILDGLGVRTEKYENVYVCDSIELSCMLTVKAIQAGAKILNVHVVEDLCVDQGRVNGLVVNLSTVYGVLHVDPLMFESKVTLDATGHDAVLANKLATKVSDCPERTAKIPGEGPMEAWSAEQFVVDNSGQYYPGLFLSGMAVCATYGGPRMGPIFGGMLQSGVKVAELMLSEIKG